MSRTNRNIKYSNPNARRIAFKNYLTNESKAVAELKEAGFTNTSGRLASFSSRIPTNYSDLAVSGYAEVWVGDDEQYFG